LRHPLRKETILKKIIEVRPFDNIDESKQHCLTSGSALYFFRNSNPLPHLFPLSCCSRYLMQHLLPHLFPLSCCSRYLMQHLRSWLRVARTFIREPLSLSSNPNQCGHGSILAAEGFEGQLPLLIIRSLVISLFSSVISLFSSYVTSNSSIQVLLCPFSIIRYSIRPFSII